MARMGQFSRSATQYGMPVGVVKPPDNNVGSRYSEDLLDPSMGLTEEQRQELQDRINELFAVLRGERDYYGFGSSPATGPSSPSGVSGTGTFSGSVRRARYGSRWG